jgi:hypothetical protein
MFSVFFPHCTILFFGGDVFTLDVLISHVAVASVCLLTNKLRNSCIRKTVLHISSAELM